VLGSPLDSSGSGKDLCQAVMNTTVHLSYDPVSRKEGDLHETRIATSIKCKIVVMKVYLISSNVKGLP
jgi:hypothetical protein